MSTVINEPSNGAGGTVYTSPAAQALRALIFQQGKPRTTTMEAWGQTIRIQTLPGKKVDDVRDIVPGTNLLDAVKQMVQWIIMAVVDDDGQPIFTEADTETLLALEANEIVRVGRAIIDFNGQSNKARDDIKKNSETTDATDSPSA